MHDLLRVEANERVDIRDFRFAVKQSLEDNVRQTLAHLVTDPAGAKMWIVDGFGMADGGANQLVITKGVALLGTNREGENIYGMLTTEGAASKTLDLTGYAASTHSIYVRFSLIEADEQGRIFWNSSGNGSEYSQSIRTRWAASWEARVETTNPGADWLKIGQVDPSDIPGTLVDQRPLYFEGVVSDTYAVTWGAGDDRNADRQQYGIKDLQTFVEMVRTSLGELRSTSGTRKWYEAGVRDLTVDWGLRVGFTGGPGAADRIELGDASTYMQFNAGNLELFAGGYRNLVVHSGDGVSLEAGLRVGFAGIPTELDGIELGDTDTHLSYDSGNLGIYAGGAVALRAYAAGGATAEAGLRVGFAGAPTDTDVVEVGDATFQLQYNSGSPRVYFDANEGLVYDRSANHLTWEFGAGTARHRLHSDGGMEIAGGLRVGAITATPTDNTIYIGDPQFFIQWASSTRRIEFDTDDYLHFDEASSSLQYRAGGVEMLGVYANGRVNINSSLRVGFTGTAAADRLEVGDVNFYLDKSGTNPTIGFDTGDTLVFNRTANEGWEFNVGSAALASIKNPSGDIGEAGLADTDGTIQTLDGDDFALLSDIVAVHKEQSFVMSGLAMYYDRSLGKAGLRQGVGFTANGNQLRMFQTPSTFEWTSIGGNWLSDAPSTTTSAWGFVFLKYVGPTSSPTHHISRWPPQEGRVHDQETGVSAADRGDYLFVGSIQVIYKSTGTPEQYLAPFVRYGDRVHMRLDDPNGSGSFIQTSSVAGVNATKVLDLTPAGHEYYYPCASHGLAITHNWTPVTGLIVQASLTLAGVATAVVAANLFHGTEPADTWRTLVANSLVCKGISGESMYATAVSDVMVEGTSPDQVTLAYDVSALAAGTLVYTVTPLGYIEPLNLGGYPLQA